MKCLVFRILLLKAGILCLTLRYCIKMHFISVYFNLYLYCHGVRFCVASLNGTTYRTNSILSYHYCTQNNVNNQYWTNMVCTCISYTVVQCSFYTYFQYTYHAVSIQDRTNMVFIRIFDVIARCIPNIGPICFLPMVPTQRDL